MFWLVYLVFWLVNLLLWLLLGVWIRALKTGGFCFNTNSELTLNEALYFRAVMNSYCMKLVCVYPSLKHLLMKIRCEIKEDVHMTGLEQGAIANIKVSES